MDPIPLIFVNGAPGSGKTRLIDALMNDGDHNLTLLPSAIQEASVARFGGETVRFIDVRFPTEQAVILVRLKNASLMGQNSLVAGILKLMLGAIKDACDHIRSSDEDGVTAIVVENNPLFFRLIWSKGSDPRNFFQQGVVADIEVIEKLLKLKAYPLCTYTIPPDLRPGEVIRGYTSPANECFNLDKTSLSSIVSMCSIISSRPSKNTGELIWAQLDTFDGATIPDEWEVIPSTLHIPRSGIPGNKFTFVDGNIGCGKTTLTKEIATEHGSIALLEAIRSLSIILKLEIDPAIRTHVVETSISYLFASIVSHALVCNPGEGVEYICERNRIYSDWIFGAVDTPYPSANANVLSYLLNNGIYIGPTIYIRLEPDVCMERSTIRGRECDTKWTREDFDAIHERLEILFNSPFEWPYAETILRDNPTRDITPVRAEEEISPDDDLDTLVSIMDSRISAIRALSGSRDPPARRTPEAAPARAPEAPARRVPEARPRRALDARPSRTGGGGADIYSADDEEYETDTASDDDDDEEVDIENIVNGIIDILV